MLLKHRRVNAQLSVVCHHPLVGDSCTLLHHIAKVTRQRELSLTWGEQRLYVENISTHSCPRKTRNNAHHILNLVLVVEVLWLAENLLDICCRNLRGVGLLKGDILCSVASKLCNILVQRTHARLASVLRDNLLQNLL